MRLRLHVAYGGTNYHGWQIQPEDRTIEGELTRAAAQMLDCAESEVVIQGASRTDSGVHALGQVAHLDHGHQRGRWEWVRGLNALTEHDICVTRVEEVDPDFHARFSARGKIYRYDIWNHRFQHPLRYRRTWQIKQRLDVERMQRAAADMEGHHDFEAFRAADCDSHSSDRHMRRVEVTREGPLVRITVEGDAFLKYMVRVMVGTLVRVGRGKMSADSIPEILASRDRHRAGRTAPARGLTLVRIFYPDFPWTAPPPEIGGEYLVD